MQFLARKIFLVWGILYVVIFLLGLLALAIFWLPPGYAVVGHDSGLPLGAKTFLLSRLYAWDDRLGFGLDNSANFGSLTVHFFDLLSSFVGGVPYAGNFFAIFFWLGLIFLSGFIFSYQLKDILGKPFVFILPVLLTFNFYIFQSVFMLERAKFGLFSATLVSLALYINMQQKKIPVVVAALISAIVFSIFNGGGWFGVTLYAGIAIVFGSLIIASIVKGIANRSFDEFNRTAIFLGLTAFLYLIFNTYSIISYLQIFLENDASRLLQESTNEGHKDWLRYVSRSSSFINLFRLFGVPDWYGEYLESGKANISHPYAQYYLNNKFIMAGSMVFPILAFGSFLLAKTKQQKNILGLFGLITLVELIFTAGSQPPFGTLYEFLMDNLPGFFILRSAFYKFGIYYFFALMVLISFTLSILIEKLADVVSRHIKNWVGFGTMVLSVLLVFGLWFGYHWVLFDPGKVFSWKSDQSTRVQPPGYIYDFAKFVHEKKLNDNRILLLPPVNKDWQNDGYNWGYWSLSPVTYALSDARILSNWHGLTGVEAELVERLYRSVKNSDKEDFVYLANRLNVGYVLMRNDVLVDSKWSSSELPDNYSKIINQSFKLEKEKSFGSWVLYKIEPSTTGQIFAISAANTAPDNSMILASDLFRNDHSIGLFDEKRFEEIESVSLNKINTFDCLSCFLERQDRLKILPMAKVLPTSFLYYLKEKNEQKVLTKASDSRSKIGNYLGVIFIRVSELKRMLDMSERELVLIEQIRVIRSYLKNLRLEIESTPTNSVNFELTKQVFDYISPTERAVSDYMKTNAGKQKSHRFGEEMLGVLWEINQIRKYFAPLLDNLQNWSKEKVYKIDIPEEGKYTIAFVTQAFPLDLSGDRIIPKKVKFTKDGKESNLKLSKGDEDFLRYEVGEQTKGVAELRLYFDELPNLFTIEGSGLEEFPFGNVACYNGKIKNFDRARAYNVKISKTDRSRYAQIIFKDKDHGYSEKHGFLKGEDTYEIPSVIDGEYSRYNYFPSAIAKNIYIYICSEDRVLPQIKDVYVTDLFSPSVITIKNADPFGELSPSIEYKKVNPTKYEVFTQNNPNQYILVFNERYNASWKLYQTDGEGNSEIVNTHFMVDGYANGWLVKNPLKRKMSIEYSPQSGFYIGSGISASVLVFSLGSIIYWISRKKKGDKSNEKN